MVSEAFWEISEAFWGAWGVSGHIKWFQGSSREAQRASVGSKEPQDRFTDIRGVFEGIQGVPGSLGKIPVGLRGFQGRFRTVIKVFQGYFREFFGTAMYCTKTRNTKYICISF